MINSEESRSAAPIIFEGMTSIRSVIAAMESGISDRRIVRVVCSRSRTSAREKELSYLRRIGEKYSFPVEIADDEYVASVATGATHGGMIAECTARTIPELTSAELPKNGFYVMLEGIEDPYNFGYAIRSIYASGADGIILPPHNRMSAAGIVARASAGTSEMIQLFVSEVAEAAAFFSNSEYKVVAAGIRDSVSAFDADLKKPLLLIVGGEKRGISRAVLETVDCIVRLDYGREFRGSLSAASAVSVLSYEVLRQNR